jgi:hypothetical protein
LYDLILTCDYRVRQRQWWRLLWRLVQGPWPGFLCVESHVYHREKLTAFIDGSISNGLFRGLTIAGCKTAAHITSGVENVRRLSWGSIVVHTN